MSRPQIPLSALALFCAWTLLVGWVAARWGATYARGKLPEPIPETPGGLEQLTRRDVTLIAVERADLGSSLRFLEPQYSTGSSIGGDRKVHVKSKPLDNGGLQVTVDDFNGFYGETTTIDLLHGDAGDVFARVEVSGFGDNGPVEWTWEKPGGWVVVTRRDWSNLTSEQPLFVRFHLYDGEDPLHRCARGFVRVPE